MGGRGLFLDTLSRIGLRVVCVMVWIGVDSSVRLQAITETVALYDSEVLCGAMILVS